MPPYKIINPHRKMCPPISMRQDWETKKWFLYDKTGIIIAEEIKRDDARTMKDALNNIGITLNYLVNVLEFDVMMAPLPNIPIEYTKRRIQLFEEIFEYLVNLGIIKESDIDYKEDFKLWADKLRGQLLNEEAPLWTKLYHALKKEPVTNYNKDN